VPPYEGTLSATKYGPACPQQTPSPLVFGSFTVDIAGPPLSPDQIDDALKISRLQATDVLESDEDCELDSSSPLNVLAFADVYFLRSFDQRH
jgi:acetylcholinesterase